MNHHPRFFDGPSTAFDHHPFNPWPHPPLGMLAPPPPPPLLAELAPKKLQVPHPYYI